VREVIHAGRIVTLERLDGRYEVVRHADSVAVLVAEGRRVLGVRQRRVAIGRVTWEVPAGLVEPGETPAEAAARELAEEVGLTGELTPLTSCYVSPGFTDERAHLFRAEGTSPLRLQGDDDEDLEPEWRDALEAWRAVAAGDEVTSATTLLALAVLLGARGELP
jgi:ADP-ribose pyrophosphatase